MELKELFTTLEFDKILNHLADRTTSPLGQELLSQVEPSDQIPVVEKKLKQVTEMKAILDFDDPFPIDGIKDIRDSLSKASIEGSFINPQNMIEISQTLAVGRKLYQYFKERRDKYPFLQKIAEAITPYERIEREIERSIDPSSFEVRDEASNKLAGIRREVLIVQDRARRRLEQILKSLAERDYLQEELITLREGRLVLMVKEEHRNRVKGLVHDQSASGATLFIEPIETLELNNQIRGLKLEEKREVERILQNLTGMVREELEGIWDNLKALAQLDIVYAKARFSIDLGGNQPRLSCENQIQIMTGRHPLLILREDSRDKVIPLDLEIGEDFNSLVITGPNAGGKTVALKTVGLLTLMTQCGLHIPADPNSNMGLFSGVFADIGDQQSIEMDLSTFTSHMGKIKQITTRAGKGNLVLIDEIGAGTDPEEGAALAMSILEKLTAKGCINIVTTHQGTLKAFAHETDGVENGSMEFDVQTLQPTYRFRLGMPGSSYAFDIAQRLGISEEIIQRSRELVGQEKNKLENLIINLEQKVQQYHRLSGELGIKESRLEGLIKLYREKYEAIKNEEKALKKKAVLESEEILRRANSVVEQAIREIRERQAAKEAIKRSKELIRAEKEKLEQELEKVGSEEKVEAKGLTPDEVEIGNQVIWRNYNAVGTILSEVDASGRVLLQSRNLKVRVPLSELEKVVSPQGETPKSFVSYSPKSHVSYEISLRGMRVDEALIKVDKFLDDAYLAGLNQVRIIHGKGTGVLRNSIGEFLDSHPRVKSKHLGNWNEGGSGVTVVELKEN